MICHKSMACVFLRAVAVVGVECVLLMFRPGQVAPVVLCSVPVSAQLFTVLEITETL